MTANPYRWDIVQPDLFYGRDALRREIADGLAAGRSFGLAGGRRMGKTTLLRRVEADLLEQADEARAGGLLLIPVYLDVHALPQPLSADGVFDAVHDSILPALPDRADLGARAPRHPAARRLAEHVAGARAGRPQVMVLFDEIKPLVDAPWGPALFANWRSFLHNEPTLSPYLSAVFAGHTALDALQHDIGSPLVNILTNRGLALFDPAATAALAREPSGLPLDDAFCAALHRETGGHPFLIQFIMHHVVAARADDPTAALFEASERFGRDHRHQLERWWERLDARARKLWEAAERAGDSGAGRGEVAGLEDPVAWDRAAALLATSGLARRDHHGRLVTAGAIFERFWREVAGDRPPSEASTRAIPSDTADRTPSGSTIGLPGPGEVTLRRDPASREGAAAAALERALAERGLSRLLAAVVADPTLLPMLEGDSPTALELRGACARDMPCLGRYLLIEEIGKGGMGRVYRAFDLKLRRAVAIKLIRDAALADDLDRARFLREARLAARLRHPAIVGVHDVCEHPAADGGPPQIYIVMDYIRGRSVHQILLRERMSPEQAAGVAADLAHALAHAHREGALHRDVKPHNVLLDEEGHVHLVDFGLARDLTSEDDLTRSDAVLGTPAYLAPEQIRCRREEQGPATDVWSVGVVLYRCLTGRLPFEGEGAIEMMQRICSDEPTPPAEVDPDVPEALGAIVMRCLRKDPADRWPTAAALGEALEGWLGG